MATNTTPRSSRTTKSGRARNDEGRRATGQSDEARGTATSERKSGSRKKAPSGLNSR